MNTQELIPQEGLEYKLISYALEDHMMTGEVLKFDFLYHQKTILSFKKIGTGAPLFEIMPLDETLKIMKTIDQIRHQWYEPQSKS